MSILYISSLVPDISEYRNKALNRSGNNVLTGIADALYKEHGKDVTLVSLRPVPSFPDGRLCYGRVKEQRADGSELDVWPVLNIKIIKDIYWGIFAFFYIIGWAFRNRHNEREILSYNIYSPPIGMLFRVCRLTRIKLFIILYDLGVPPKRLGLSKVSMLGYQMSENAAHKYIPKLDGRIVINESIVREYAPNKDYILIDGGVNNSLISKLFPLEVSNQAAYTFVLAGMLWDQNGTQLLLEALRLTNNPLIRVQFAGKGNDVELIQKAAQEDSRISYLGMLTVDELLKVYSEADVLLNLRIEESVDFHYPSKLLEYLLTGKYVVSTPVAHTERDYGAFMSILHDVTPKGLVDLMESICNMTKTQLYEVGLNARKFMLENRTWDIRTREILEYMKSVDK